MKKAYLILFLCKVLIFSSCALEEQDDEEVKNLVITLFPPTVNTGSCTSFNVEAINHERQPTNPEQDLVIVYTAELGSFYDDPNCQNSVTSTNLPASTFFTTAYYKSDTAGTDKILAVEDPDIGIQGDVKNIEVVEEATVNTANSEESTAFASALSSEEFNATNQQNLLARWSRCLDLKSDLLIASYEDQSGEQEFVMELHYLEFEQPGTYQIGSGDLNLVYLRSSVFEEDLLAVEGTITITSVSPLMGSFVFTDIESNGYQYSGELTGMFSLDGESGIMNARGTLGLEGIEFVNESTLRNFSSTSQLQRWEFASDGETYSSCYYKE